MQCSILEWNAMCVCVLGMYSEFIMHSHHVFIMYVFCGYLYVCGVASNANIYSYELIIMKLCMIICLWTFDMYTYDPRKPIGHSPQANICVAASQVSWLLPAAHESDEMPVQAAFFSEPTCEQRSRSVHSPLHCRLESQNFKMSK